jgi:hypothetical protein
LQAHVALSCCIVMLHCHVASSVWRLSGVASSLWRLSGVASSVWRLSVWLLRLAQGGAATSL